jgi:hypothetical protein
MFNKEKIAKLERDIDLLFNHINALYNYLGIEEIEYIIAYPGKTNRVKLYSKKKGKDKNNGVN